MPLPCPYPPTSPTLCTRASFILQDWDSVFNNPQRVAHALSSSPRGKNVLEGELCSLRNDSSLVFQVLGYHNLKVPELSKSSFTLGDWEVTCCRTEKDDDYQSTKVGQLAEETTTEKV